jgi:hypothetical protein
MELSAFGAIMEFALKRENEFKDIVEDALGREGLDPLKELLDGISRDARKNLKTLERTRRENINEMVIAPISGLEGDDYVFEAMSIDGMSAAEFARYAGEILERSISFFRDAADKVPIEEARRAFQRLAKKKTSLRESIEGFCAE